MAPPLLRLAAAAAALLARAGAQQTGDPCAGGATLAGGGEIDFTGGYPDNADCTPRPSPLRPARR